jgi:uncharacterized protein (DUF305 family)
MIARRLLGTAAAAFASGLLLAGCACMSTVAQPETTATTTAASHHEHEALMAAGAHQASSGFQREMDAGMARMMEDMHSPGFSGHADIDFLAMMIPHHAGAVEMARLLLQHGRDPATRQLAEEIIASQVVEIESMTRRLAALRQGSPTDSAEEFPALGGTRGP